jgi:hypothetical protein
MPVVLSLRCWFVDGLIEGESKLHQSPGSFYVRLDRGVFDAELVGGLQAFVGTGGPGIRLFLTEVGSGD